MTRHEGGPSTGKWLRDGCFTRELDERLMELRKAGRTCKEIEGETGIHFSCVGRRLLRLGLPAGRALALRSSMCVQCRGSLSSEERELGLERCQRCRSGNIGRLAGRIPPNVPLFSS